MQRTTVRAVPGIPAVGLAGWSGSGKTTLLEKLIPVLKEKGIRTIVIKHDVHGLKTQTGPDGTERDAEGTDSRRLADAGAEAVIVCGPEGPDLPAALAMAENRFAQSTGGKKRLIILEGFKHAAVPKIGICREANGKGFTESLSGYIAAVTDRKIECGIPVFGLNETGRITSFIETFIEEETMDFTHFDESGRAFMVDVGDKGKTVRNAVAKCSVLLNEETFALVKSGGMKKGDVLTVAQIAGIMGAKRTPDLIPMCHPVLLDGVNVRASLDEARHAVEIESSVRCDGRTGVEMEALTAVSVAALTVYDMCKAVQKDIVITDIRLMEKTGGFHGDYKRKGESYDDLSGCSDHRQ